MGILNKIILATAVIVVFLLAVCVDALQQQARQLIDERHTNTLLTDNNQTLTTTITALKKTATLNQQRLTQQHAIQQRLQAKLSEREQQIQELQHDNAHIQNWANTPLPDAIISLRQRPANYTATPDNIDPTLPGSTTLRPTSSQPDN